MLGITVENFYSRYEQNRDKIINIYKAIPGELNTNSMTLYSGDTKKIPIFIIKNKKRTIIIIENSGCIYTGDYNLKGKRKWNQFHTAFSLYFDKTGIIQIPHHGSSYNYNQEFNFKPNLFSIISAGKTNKYRHPHVSTLRNIILKDGIPIIVTEDDDTQFIQEIYPL